MYSICIVFVITQIKIVPLQETLIRGTHSPREVGTGMVKCRRTTNQGLACLTRKKFPSTARKLDWNDKTFVGESLKFSESLQTCPLSNHLVLQSPPRGPWITAAGYLWTKCYIWGLVTVACKQLTSAASFIEQWWIQTVGHLATEIEFILGIEASTTDYQQCNFVFFRFPMYR